MDRGGGGGGDLGEAEADEMRSCANDLHLVERGGGERDREREGEERERGREGGKRWIERESGD